MVKHRKGGFINMSVFLPYFNEACIVLSALSMAVGWGFIRRKKIELHKRFMLIGVTLAALFFISYVLKTILVGDTSFGGPQGVRGFYYAFLQTHSILASIVPILGIFTLVYAYKRNFRLHRRFGPWTAGIWFVTAATGLVVFVMLYIIYPPGETTNLFHAWVGH